MLKAGVFRDHGLLHHPVHRAPRQGVNAQDALILAYSAVAMLRQQSRPHDLVHGIIESGGGPVVNVILTCATASFMIRAASDADLAHWTARLIRCFEAGARLTPGGNGTSETLPDAATSKLKPPQASTDEGNLSWEYLSLQPLFWIRNVDGSVPVGLPHTEPFEIASGGRCSQPRGWLPLRSMF